MRRLVLLGVFALTVFAAALVALLPARVVLDPVAARTGLVAEQVHGPVWNAQLYGVRFGGQSAERVDLSLAFWPLLRGAMVVDVAARGEGLTLSGRLERGGGEVRVRDLAGALDAWRLPGAAELGVINAEGLVFSLDEAVFDETAGCVSASGVVRSQLLVDAGARFGAELPVIEGVLACAGPRLGVDASGESAVVALEGRARLGVSGYDWVAQARGEDGEIAVAMLALGFEDDGEGWRLEGSGVYPRR
jgi:hypothetical protein